MISMSLFCYFEKAFTHAYMGGIHEYMGGWEKFNEISLIKKEDF